MEQIEIIIQNQADCETEIPKTSSESMKVVLDKIKKLALDSSGLTLATMEHFCQVLCMSVSGNEVDSSNPGSISMLCPSARRFIRVASVDSAV